MLCLTSKCHIFCLWNWFIFNFLVFLVTHIRYLYCSFLRAWSNWRQFFVWFICESARSKRPCLKKSGDPPTPQIDFLHYRMSVHMYENTPISSYWVQFIGWRRESAYLRGKFNFYDSSLLWGLPGTIIEVHCTQNADRLWGICKINSTTL